MLSRNDVERIEENWNPPRWPLGPAADYAKAMHRRPFSYFCERIKHLGVSGKFAIDAGCGTGTWSFALATAFKQVLAIDYTLDRVELANALKGDFKLEQPDFQKGDIRAIPVTDGTADAVFCYSVALGAVPLGNLLAEFYRVLRPGGVAYVELNGIGYGWNLFRMEGRNKQIGGDVVYNTYGQGPLALLLPSIIPQGMHNLAVLRALESGSPLAAIKAADPAPETLAAANAIIGDLAGTYIEMLRGDLVAIARGERDHFSRPSTGRGYMPEEVRGVALQAGFQRFEWAPEGTLSLQPDGSVKKAKSAIAPPNSVPEFEGHLRRFESLNWK